MIISDNTEISGGIVADGTFFPQRLLQSGTIRIILHSECNYYCSFCFSEGQPKKVSILDIDFLKKVLIVAKEFGISKVKLSGGEPLLYPKLEHLLSFLRTEGFTYIDLTTNASLLDTEMLSLLNRYSVNATTISLNSLNKERYQSLTRSPSFDVVYSNILSAKNKFNGHIRLNSVVYNDTKFTIEDYINIFDFCMQHDFGLRIVEPTTVKGMPNTYSKTAFSKVVNTLKEKSITPIKSDCTSVEYLFYKHDRYITVMRSLCDNGLCGTCKKYMYLRLSSQGALKPCLARTDTEFLIAPESSTMNIRRAFIFAINDMGNGVKTFHGLNNPFYGIQP